VAHELEVAVNDKINLGCGSNMLPGYINVDWSPRSGADVICDLNRAPWPFEADAFSEVLVEHLIEHLDDPDLMMREIYRISRSGARVRIITPHFSSYQSYGDLSHQRHCGLSVLLPYCDAGWNSFGARSGAHFRLLRKRLLFGRSPLAWPGRILAGVSLEFYQNYFAFIFPCRNMEFILETLK